MNVNRSVDGSKWTDNLPKPPVPSLELTIQRYLAGLAPVIPANQLEQTKQTAQCFLADEGQKLQKLLAEYAEQADNWMTDIWLDEFYLLNPLPLVVNSNPFFLLPRQHFATSLEQIYFAAQIVHYALRYRDEIESQSLGQELGTGQKCKQKLCMQTYEHFFTACRLPGATKDILRIETKKQNHFVVAAFNRFFVIHFDDSTIPSVDELWRSLYSVWCTAKNEGKKLDDDTTGDRQNVGILTAENRQTWAAARLELLEDQTNRANLESIESCLFVLCLDDFVAPKMANWNSIEMAKMDRSYMTSMLLHGGGGRVHTSNRWFDKFMQIIISKEGICGFVVEHSASEGITVMNFAQKFMAFIRTESSGQVKTAEEVKRLPPTLKIDPLRWNISDSTETRIRAAEKSVDKLVGDLNLYVFKFEKFGRDWIKTQRISPDVFIQLALQLTYFKLNKRLVSTYESCSLRQFRRGRVDNIRSATIEALEWARCMCAGGGDDMTEEEKITLFKRAISKQTEVLKYTASGFGPDNHLMALKEMAKSHLPALSQLFKEKSYKEFWNFKLSTSQLPLTEDDLLVGYGPVVPDGYGCCYQPKPNMIYFTVTSFFSSYETSSNFFAFSLESSLQQMRELCLKMNQPS